MKTCWIYWPTLTLLQSQGLLQREKGPEVHSLDQLLKQKNVPDTQQEAFKTGFTEGFMRSQAFTQRTQGMCWVVSCFRFSLGGSAEFKPKTPVGDINNLRPPLFWQTRWREPGWSCWSSYFLVFMACQEPHFSLVKAPFLMLVCVSFYSFPCLPTSLHPDTHTVNTATQQSSVVSVNKLNISYNTCWTTAHLRCACMCCSTRCNCTVKHWHLYEIMFSLLGSSKCTKSR